MEWLRKLGHGKRPVIAGATVAGRSQPTLAVDGTPERMTSNGEASATLLHSSKPKIKSPTTSFVRQASSLGIASRKKQTVANNNTLDVSNRRRRSSHHTSSIKSGRLKQSRDLLSPPRQRSSIARYPRTFMTRSSMSPSSSYISSQRSRRSSSETEHSLAASYLDVNDPDSRSFVPSVDADEDASLRPFPPSLRPSSRNQRADSVISVSSPRRRANSVVSVSYSQNSPSRGNRIFERDMNARDGPSDNEPSPSGFPLRRSSESTMATQSSLGAHSRTWTSDRSRGTRSIDTRPTTILSSLELPRVAHIAQVPPPRVMPHHRDQNRPPFVTLGGASSLAASPSILDASAMSAQRRAASGSFPSLGQIHRTLTWDSGLSASPSVSSPLATAIFPFPTSADLDSTTDSDIVHDMQSLHSSTAHAVETTVNLEDGDETSVYPCHVPHHSHPHPRDNPRPLSPPNENASVLTLASSNFTDAGRGAERHHPRSTIESTIAYNHQAQARRRLSGGHLAPPSSTMAGRDHVLTPVGHIFPSLQSPAESVRANEDDDEAYDDHQTPVMLGSYNERDGSFRFENHRPLSYFDRASSYYFNPGGGGAGSLRASLGGGGGGTTGGGRRMSLLSSDDRAGWAVDDRASVTAMRRRGSWESGESSFSWAGAGGGNIATPTIGVMPGPVAPALPASMATPVPPSRDSFSFVQPQYFDSGHTDEEDGEETVPAATLAKSLDELNVNEEKAVVQAGIARNREDLLPSLAAR